MKFEKIVLASGNKGKLAEFNRLLNNHKLDVVPQSEFNVPDADETGLTFVENAILKARHACELTGLPAISDDSGLEVDALNGAPGIYSARYSKEGATDQENCDKLLSELALLQPAQTTPEKHAANSRNARYQCVLVFMRHVQDPTPIICQGTWEGSILTSPIGDGGFGYDPLFWLEDNQCSAAQLPYEIKNMQSHRAIAMKKLMHKLLPILAAD